MARPPRLHVPGGLYHVLARGNNRQRIYRQPADYRFYLARLAKLLPRTETRCYAYCLMPNHLHLLLEPGPKPLSRIMQPLQLGYSLYFNRQYRHAGHVFQGRYTAILCERDAYLLELVRYLHLNPVRAGLVKRPGAWAWSSHGAYVGGTAAPVPLHVEGVLGQFGKDSRRARSAFQDFVLQSMTVGHRNELYETIESRVLGTDAFAGEVLQPGRAAVEAPPVEVTIDQVLEAAAGAWGLDPHVLRAPTRLRRAAQARAAAGYLAREVAGQPLTALARAAGRDVASLSFGMRRLEAALVKDAEVSGRLAAAVSALRSGARPSFRRRKP